MLDYLIIGHGLAGAALSHQLMHGGNSVCIIDSGKNRCSAIAAGLYNPVTGRQMVKTWMADLLFSEIEPFYEWLEGKLAASFLHKTGIYRPFLSMAEQNDWQAKSSDPIFKPLIHRISTQPLAGFAVKDSYGGLYLNRSGYVDLRSLLTASAQLLQDQALLKTLDFDESELQIKDDHISFRDIQAKRLIFCNGSAAIDSGLFGWLPFRPVKGEILDLRIDNMPEIIVNRGIFILPREGQFVRVGSTYQNNFDTLEPTEAGKNELEGKLVHLISEKYEVLNAMAGIRPATKDRRPFIGKHPDYEHIYMFNGFGSKGVSMIPYFSKHFVEYLEGKIALLKEVDIARYLQNKRQG